MTRRRSSRVRRAVRAARLACGVALLGAMPLRAQDVRSVPLARAIELESTGKSRDAVPLYRQALVDPAAGDEGRSAAILGLERVWDELGQRDSIVPVVATVLRTRPADPTLRGVQLRALVTLRRDEEARGAYDAWRRAAPGDPAPFREYARLLLQAGRTAAADTVLREAVPALRGPRGQRALALELAQLHVALGAWTRAGESWRQALDAMPYVEIAALFALQAAPLAVRDSVLPALLAPPAALVPRRVAAGLLMAWRRPREAWQALGAVAPDDSSRAAWRELAERLESAEAWPVAREAWTRVFDGEREAEAGRRAAVAALAAGDAAGALALLDRATSAAGGTSPGARADAAILRVRALGALGRAAEAERAAQALPSGVSEGDRARIADALAEAWIASGDVTRARAALAVAGAREDAPVAGWLALYAGDLKRARALLKRPAEDASATRTELAMTALAVVARTRADSAPAVGAAFLSAARGDSARAAAQFVEAAATMPEAASLLTAAAARLQSARGDTAAALPLWQRIATQYAGSPEAPEAELAWARQLQRRGDVAGARTRLEHLIVTYPESALVPIARRELESARTP
jgi:tetratricopeptide (TPR) repeat protein